MLHQWQCCWFCGCKLTRKCGDPRQRTVDHFIPRWLGGEKFVDACLKCNNDKAHSSAQEYKEWLGIEKFFGEEKGWNPW